MLLVSAFLGVLLLATLCKAEKVKKDNFKDQFCTDPRTMEQHAAYDEWPDSYSCTRHRCQPGGRSLAIYTVGCKRVEAPESAIECEEVVEDTNMQFPFCCTRLRCLVVVRGEVWTRVLGQPWETLPAAPWSHMYKMKKPPPGEKTFPIKNNQGPIYELQSENDNAHDKILRTSKKSSTSAPDIDEPVVRAIPSPDIVIALSTPNDEKVKTNDNNRHKRVKTTATNDKNEGDEEADKERIEVEIEDVPANEKASWTEIPSSQWNVHDPAMDVENSHALVDAIGTRMRDIESVVQRMSEKVHSKPAQQYGSSEKRANSDITNKHPVADENINAKDDLQPEKGKKAIPDTDHYNRFSVKNRGSKYLHPADGTSEQPVFVEDTNLNGYFSDASNSVLRRSNSPKEPPPAPTYVAPVDNRRRHADSEEGEKKHKKHAHKKKRKGKGHKKRHNKDEKRKHFNRLASVELDKNLVSLEDSAASNI